GFYANWLVGKRVSCRAPEDGNGTWAENMVCPADLCVPLRQSVTLEQGSSLLQIARQEKRPAFVQTAAASALGRMLPRLAKRFGMESINIVRRREQVE